MKKTLHAVNACLLCVTLSFCGCVRQTSTPPVTSEMTTMIETVPDYALVQDEDFIEPEDVQNAVEPENRTSAEQTTSTVPTQSAARTQDAETGAKGTSQTTQMQPTQQTHAAQTETIRAVWISYYEIATPKTDRSERTFRATAKEMARNISEGGMNTVFLHVRPASDAIYRSSVFPYSAYISGTEGKDPGYDALQIFCACAKEKGLSVHAWINPFRVGNASNLDEKADSNPAKRILTDDDPDNDSRVVKVSGSLYYDPADPDNQDLIVEGVRELLQNYAIDGIHIDDYFYPSTDTYIDQKDYDTYLAQGGTLQRGDWRRTQINTLVSRLYSTVKSFGAGKIFSISPSMEIEKNRSTLYADVARWAAYSGYCDWLIPQAYVGFEHETHPFREIVRQWQSLPRSAGVRLLFGLAAYKCGTEDKYAGSGRKEWINHTDILSRQIRYMRESSDSYGFALFSYSYIFGGNLSDISKKEIKSVISVL